MIHRPAKIDSTESAQAKQSGPLQQMSLTDHPGNLGSARGSLLTLHHADWPAYPSGDDSFEILFQFSAFPHDTEFVVIDDVDQSLLLIADVRCGRLHEPLDPSNFHLAAWHEDLAELQSRGFVDGITPITARQWAKNQWEKLMAAAPEGLCYRDLTGKLVPLQQPCFEAFEDDQDFADYVAAPSQRVRVTPGGRQFVQTTLAASPFDIAAAISEKAKRLYQLQYFDTCIREACVQLESEIKQQTGSTAWGDRLTENFIEHLRKQEKFLESGVRTFRQELRSVFKLIRNDYMHNLSEADEITALVVLKRIARIRSMVDPNFNG